MSAGTISAEVEFGNLDYKGEPVIRFLRGIHLLGQTPYVEGKTLVEHALEAGVDIPTNCKSGTCGSCMVTLLMGEVPLPSPLPPGLDDFLVDEGARLGCIGLPIGDVDIDLRPPI
jgi:ferredoxin